MISITKQEIREMASNQQTFSRGMDYFNGGLVKKLRFLPAEMVIEAEVSGSEDYHVRIDLDSDGEVDDYTCSCPAYEKYDGACKHIVAVLLETLKRNNLENPPSASKKPQLSNKTALHLVHPTPPREDPRLALSKNMVARLVQTNETIFVKELVALQVTLFLDPKSYDLPHLELKIGQQRLYNVKNINELLETILGHHELYFGKTFTFQPLRQQFQPLEQQLIDLLLEAYHDEQRNRYYYSSGYAKQRFSLNPSRLKRFLNLAPSLEQVVWIKGYNSPPTPIQVYREPLPITLRLAQGKEHLELGMHLPEPLFQLAYAKEIYICGNRFYIPPAETLQPLTPILECFANNPNNILPFVDEDAAAFIAEAAPAIQESCRLEIAPEVERRLHRESLTISIWLDKYGPGISAKVLFQYGEIIEINPLMSSSGQQNREKLLLREKANEVRFLNRLAEANFQPQGELYLLTDETQTYRFLRDILPQILECAEVYHSEAFDSLRIKRTPKFSGAIRLNEATDLLEVSFQMEDLPDSELMELLAALRERRKYFRLKSGTFIPLDEPETIAAGQLLDQLGLTGNDLQKKLVALPKYRALYLERAIRDYGRERFNLNTAFRQLIRDVKEPQDLECPLPECLVDVLRDYQKTGFKWLKTLSHYGFGGILADDMGLGKTLQIIALVHSEYQETHLPSLVIAPSSLVYNWREEIAKFTPNLPALILDGQKKERLHLLEQAAAHAFVITSYPLIRRDIEELKELEFAFCFLDEAQNIKNPETINAKSVKQIKARRSFAITGTPIENSLTELWSIFDFLMPGYLYSHHKFQSRFETPVVKNNDPEALEDLGRHIRPFVLRRLKKDVLTELPEKIETKLACEMTGEQKKVYSAYLAKARAEFEAEVGLNGFEKSQIKILALLTRLRQICCHPSLFLEDYHGGSGKLDLVEEVIHDSLSGGHHILLFSQFVSMLALIEDKLRGDQIRYFRLDGQTPPEERLQLVNRFNKGEAQVFLISLKAGGTGLNLTGADTVIHYDPWWNPAVEEQATDRAYRIGQKNAVQVFKLVTHGAIEEKIYTMQQKKKELINAVIQPGENFLGKMKLEEIRGLFEE